MNALKKNVFGMMSNRVFNLTKYIECVWDDVIEHDTEIMFQEGDIFILSTAI